MIKPMLSAVFASITGLWKRKVYCDHLFRAKDMQPRDENGMVKWHCCKCNKLFVEPYGLKILENGTCDGKWGSENWNVGNTLLSSGWISVDERPLFTKDDKGNWTCTEDGDKEFIAALPYNDSKRPNEELWWIRHCVVVDETGLCVVTDDDTEPAGWNLEDVTHWMPMPEPPSAGRIY